MTLPAPSDGFACNIACCWDAVGTSYTARRLFWDATDWKVCTHWLTVDAPFTLLLSLHALISTNVPAEVVMVWDAPVTEPLSDCGVVVMSGVRSFTQFPLELLKVDPVGQL